ncbi:MAG: hypothetical protein A2014_09930 [Spirochaetes bacterium GWF1_49_6]|nr:MAG: hypothetical protein A2014_09930 [Spirochaetes bacterium GWF1_49_6]
MEKLDRITVSPEFCKGLPSIRETHVSVKEIVKMLVSGSTQHDVLRIYPQLEPEDIEQVKRIKEL